LAAAKPEPLPAHLRIKPWHENSNMDGSIDAAATANNYALIYGDIRRGFIIADRIGSTLEIIPNLVGTNRRPTGQRGALLWFRTGSEVVVPQALRLLDVPTTA
jgi:HK97 family phage major capsid protein